MRVLTSGLLAGAAAGLLAGLLQLYFVQPVLLHAEVYESGRLVHFGSETDPAAAGSLGGIDPLRDGLSLLFTILTYSGYALILVAAMALAEMQGATVNPRTGMIWGIAGFVVFQFAPGFTLAPELPGAAAGDLAARQYWWFGTAAITALSLWLIAFGRSWPAWGAAILGLLAPHLLGTAEPDVFTGPAPPELGALFAARAFGVGMVAWVLVGTFAGFLWDRSGQAPRVAAST